MFDKSILSATRQWQNQAAQYLLDKNLSPNNMTWLGFVIGLTAPLWIMLGFYSLAIVAIIANRICDGLDGSMARLSQATDRGAFLDIVLDFLFYSSIPLGFALADPSHNALASSVLIYAFIGTGCSFLAFAIIAEKRSIQSTAYPNKGFYYLGGLTEATETIAVFIVMCLLPQYFWLLAYSFAGLCFITTGLRIHAGWVLFD